MDQRTLALDARLADEIALVKTVWTEAINHDPAVTYICTGNQLPGRPSLGSWLSYGLGTMNQNLPAFVVMTASWTEQVIRPGDLQPALGNRLSAQPGTKAWLCAHTGDPVLYLSNPQGSTRQPAAAMLDAINRLNHNDSTSSPTPRRRPGSPSTRWRSACRRQSPS